VNAGAKAFAGDAGPNKIYFRPGCANDSTSPTRAIELLPAIFQRVANPVQPFGFTFVQSSLLLPLPDGIRDGFWNQADLPGQLDEGQPDKF
jgi:hypothetical protein